MYVGLISCLLTGLFHVLFHFCGGIFDELFDAGGVNTAVRNQFLQRPTSCFTADRIKAGNRDRFRCIIHHNIYPGGLLKGTNVTAVSANNPPLHLFVRQLHHRNRLFRHLIAGNALDGHHHQFARFLVGVFFSLILNFAHDARHILARLFFHIL